MPTGTASSRMILVPRDTPGVRIVRPLTVFGYDDRDHGGHAEIAFDDVRVPASNLIGGEGDGLRDRAGPARTRAASTTACARSAWPSARCRSCASARNSASRFGRTLAEQGVVREWVAESRIQLEALRLLVLKTAWLMDTVGNRAGDDRDPGDQDRRARGPCSRSSTARSRSSARRACRPTRRSPSCTPASGRCALADGPDEVHLNALGKAEFGR